MEPDQEQADSPQPSSLKIDSASTTQMISPGADTFQRRSGRTILLLAVIILILILTIVAELSGALLYYSKNVIDPQEKAITTKVASVSETETVVSRQSTRIAITQATVNANAKTIAITQATVNANARRINPIIATETATARLGDQANLIEQTHPPPIVRTNQIFYLYFLVQNVGGTTWSSQNGYVLTCLAGGSNSYPNNNSPPSICGKLLTAPFILPRNAEEDFVIEMSIPTPLQANQYRTTWVLTHNGTTIRGGNWYITIYVTQ